MRIPLRKSFLWPVALLVVFAGSALASHHQSLNGTWVLIPARSDFAGGNTINTGTITIKDHHHDIYISRDFNSSDQNTTSSYAFVTDGRENSTIYKPDFQSKATWDDDVLQVTTTRASGVETERYRLQPDGTLMLVIDRPDGRSLMLTFERQ